MKFTLLLVALTTLCLTGFTEILFAQNLDATRGPYLVSSSSSTTQISELPGPSSTPYIFLEWDRSEVTTSVPLFVTWIWTNPLNDVVFIQNQNISSFPSDPVQTWNTPSNWDTIAKKGDWEVSATWLNTFNGSTGGGGNGNINFTVNPEPISTLLFLFGGAPLAFGFFRNRNKS